MDILLAWFLPVAQRCSLAPSPNAQRPFAIEPMRPTLTEAGYVG